MSLANPNFQILINGIDQSAYVESFWCSDEDLLVGIGQFQVVLSEKQTQTQISNLDLNSLAQQYFPAFSYGSGETGLWTKVQIYVNSILLFTGLVEKITFQSDTGGGERIVFDGYSYAAELGNLLVTKDWSLGQYIGYNSGKFILDAVTNAGKTAPDIVASSPNVDQTGSPSYPTKYTAPGNIKRKSMHDIIRDVCSVTNFAATVDPSGNLFFFTTNPTQSTHKIDPATLLIQSMYGIHTTPNNLVQARSVRDIHEVKTLLDFVGANQGYDPSPNGLTPNSQNTLIPWTATPGATTLMQIDTSDFPSNPQGVVNSLSFTSTNPLALPRTLACSITFYSNNPIYKIKNDVDSTNFYVNFLFNDKQALNFYQRMEYTSGGIAAVGQAVNYSVKFTDTQGFTATTSANITTTGAFQLNSILDLGWVLQTLPTPKPTDLFQQPPVAYNIPNSAFNFSGITAMTLTYDAGAFNNGINFVKLADMHFVCSPHYVTSNLSSAYGERDQEVTNTNAFLNQIDLQNYGDAVAPKFQNPMLRTTITCLVDPAKIFLKAGYLINLNIPRWEYNSTVYWRILQVRWEYSKKGFLTKLDLTPAAAY